MSSQNHEASGPKKAITYCTTAMRTKARPSVARNSPKARMTRSTPVWAVANASHFPIEYSIVHSVVFRVLLLRAPSPGRSDGAVIPAEIGDSAAPQRAPASRLARSGEQRSGAPPGGRGLDDKPRGAILPERLGGMARA